MSYSQLSVTDSPQSAALDDEQQSDDSYSTLLQKAAEDEPGARRKKRGFFHQSMFPWIPHLLLLIAYSLVFFTWSGFRPPLPECDSAPPVAAPIEHWEARFDGTFAEIGDYFNVSDAEHATPGADAAWRTVEKNQIKKLERGSANFVKIDRVHVTSSMPGDSRVLAHVHRLHCLHVLWRRWHNLMSEDEVKAGITLERHDHHCFEVIRYELMCESDIKIQRVGWPGTKDIRHAWIDVADFCQNPDDEGVEAG
ncbi:hypothetical protein F5884DRAFT_877765 [Xylogone sp. PMI_703]|nr:hypothetical protein F5884DRAFT_877765 [Xylogone sp. PMI_703]